MSTDPTRDVAINDPDNYSTSERLRQIYQARRELRDMRQEAAIHRHRRPKKALSYYRTAVESYLMELDTLFERKEEGKELWVSRHFGTVTIMPPKLRGQRGSYHSINSRPSPDPKHVEIRGLKTLFELESPITRTFKIKESHELVGKKTKKVRRTAHISWTTLNAMVSATNAYVSDLGIGLEMDETDEWEI